MYPFFVLDLSPQASDEDVENRYRELVKRYPPDIHPRQFATVRKAYEAVRTQRSRLETRLFYFDERVRWEVDSLPNTTPKSQKRKRLSTQELTDYLQKTYEYNRN